MIPRRGLNAQDLPTRADRLQLSLVVPLFNEVENVEPLYRAICDALEAADQQFEVVFVDDGSDDDTLHVLESLLERDPRVRVIRLAVNSGQTVAMQVGIQRTRGDIVVTLDGDLQNDPRDIPLLVSRIHVGFDLVTGWRRHREDRLLSRKVPSLVANWLIAKFLDIPTHDLGCTLKAYRAELIREIPLYSDLHRFIPAVCSMASTRIDEIVVRHHPRLRGKSKYGIWRTGRVLLDALTVKMLLSCARRPLHWFGYGGVVAMLIASLTGFYILISPAQPLAAPQFVLPGIVILLSGLSINLLFSGIFGEIVVHTEPRERVKPLVDVTVLNRPSGDETP